MKRKWQDLTEESKYFISNRKYFEHEYSQYEEMAIEEMIEKIQANEKPIAKAKKAEDETRPMSELKKILESRLVDLQ